MKKCEGKKKEIEVCEFIDLNHKGLTMKDGCGGYG